METSAPGVVKLAGEHLVLYETPAVAAAIDLRANVNVMRGGPDTLRIYLPDLKLEAVFTTDELSLLYKSYKESNLPEFLQDAKFLSLNEKILPYAVIAARLANEFGLDVTGQSVEIRSDIPVSRGFASSGACATAYTVALVKSSEAKLSDETIIDVARDGERVVHQNPNAGGIDVYTSFYGGIVTYGKNSPAKQVQIADGLELPIFFVDTGPKEPTRVPVAKVAQFKNDNPEEFDRLKDIVNSCSVGLIEALKEGDIARIEFLMGANQNVLRGLGVSSEGLDKAVETARDMGIPSMKLTGGGMGGMAIGIAPVNTGPVIATMKELGFGAGLTSITQNGARNQIKSTVKAV